MSGLLSVRWKVEPCPYSVDGDCWCSIIVPEETFLDANGNEVKYVVDGNALTTELAEGIVIAHNVLLGEKEIKDSYLDEQLSKYRSHLIEIPHPKQGNNDK